MPESRVTSFQVEVFGNAFHPLRVTSFQAEVFGNTVPPLRVTAFQAEVFGNTIPPLRVTSFQAEVFGNTEGDLEPGLLEPLPAELLPVTVDNSIEVQLSLLEIPDPEILPVTSVADQEIELPLFDIPEAEILTLTDLTFDLPLFDLPPPEDFPLEILFSVDPDLEEVPPPEILEMSLEVESVFELPLFEVPAPELLPLEALSGHEVELGLLESLPPLVLGANPYIPAAQSKRRAEAQRSSASTNILGLDEPFRLNPSSVAYRRGGNVHTLHLAKAKPEFTERVFLFELLTPYAELDAGEFFVQSPGGYLTITNTEAFFPGLVPDEDENGIDTTQVSVTDDTFFVPALTSLPIQRIDLEE